MDPWAEARSVVCDFADVHEPTIRRLARARLEAEIDLTEARELERAQAMRDMLDGRLDDLLTRHAAGTVSDRKLATRFGKLAEYEAEAF